MTGSKLITDDRDAYSEDDHYRGQVKRKNLVSLFLHELEADRFIATHLYGAIKDLNAENSFIEMEDLLENDIMNLSTSFAR